MSALGQKPTCVAHKPMSALAQQRTFCAAEAMSALTPKADISLAYFFGAPEILTKALVRIENNIFAVLSL